jgi:hypothetical protein
MEVHMAVDFIDPYPIIQSFLDLSLELMANLL